MDLLTILNGVFALIYVGLSLLIGLHMIVTYFKKKLLVLLLVGITWIGIVTPWFPTTVSFLVALFNEVGISRELYILIGNISGPFIVIIWMYGFTEFFYKNKRTILMIFALIYAIIFETIFLYLFITEPASIANYKPPLDIDYRGIYMIVAATVIIYMLTTGLIFSYNSIKTYDKETRLKGYFLLVAFISYAVGAFLDAAVSAGITLLIITRSILILAGIMWYVGFLLPDAIKNRLLKEE
ncbi:MAG: conserved membrane protein of unknown function [Promethearchaeota archaeon]|nr:MAG: conserved membrane protein of unknown function [Candidatus Lokiarchaeota archaeon]